MITDCLCLIDIKYKKCATIDLLQLKFSTELTVCRYQELASNIELSVNFILLHLL